MPQFPRFENQLLARLPADELSAVIPHLEPIELPLAFLIVSARQKIEHVYFLESGLGSIVTVSRKGRKAEAGMFGREGFAPTPPAVGFGLSLNEVVVQSPGKGYRIEIGSFGKLRHDCIIFASLLNRCSHNLSTQVSYTALSNGIHKVDVRLARWLLMCNDRLGGHEIVITHDYIALMLAVRRPSVTDALHVLEGKGFIKSERKRITVRNRRAMEEFASDAYGGPEEEYRLLFGAPLAHHAWTIVEHRAESRLPISSR
ncbi:Crp/Fnr family transcriptional regulator [Rhizobium esperanzae]|uniref:Crp/Fnr family transcriptional regulator n=1 Tax=Rhizobium esperanzae TaxID=1967781 RepID=A0A246DPW3_9HYPH|nr:Crp/Fnr family transcriptional regulator [Rhizobium esperanzae]OWO92292.1 Crp/Fnr family transcriptional regulator [Rhizobium esperanzae]